MPENYLFCQTESPSCKEESSVNKRSKPGGDESAVSQGLDFSLAIENPGFLNCTLVGCSLTL